MSYARHHHWAVSYVLGCVRNVTRFRTFTQPSTQISALGPNCDQISALGPKCYPKFGPRAEISNLTWKIQCTELTIDIEAFSALPYDIVKDDGVDKVNGSLIIFWGKKCGPI